MHLVRGVCGWQLAREIGRPCRRFEKRGGPPEWFGSCVGWMFSGQRLVPALEGQGGTEQRKAAGGFSPPSKALTGLCSARALGLRARGVVCNQYTADLTP